MGLFDKVLGSKEADKAKMTKEEAFLSVSLAAVAADGIITDEEARGLITGLYRMKLFANVNNNQMGVMLNKLVNILQRQGIEAMVMMAKETLPADLRETAFAVATDLAFTDDDVDDSEKEILTKIQQALGIPEDKAIKIIEVMLMKNKG